MIENGLPFVPGIVVDYTEGTGLGKLTINIDGQVALDSLTKPVNETSPSTATDGGQVPSVAVNGTVLIEVSYQEH